jgi:hypothetical protein
MNRESGHLHMQNANLLRSLLLAFIVWKELKGEGRKESSWIDLDPGLFDFFPSVTEKSLHWTFIVWKELKREPWTAVVSDPRLNSYHVCAWSGTKSVEVG